MRPPLARFCPSKEKPGSLLKPNERTPTRLENSGKSRTESKLSMQTGGRGRFFTSGCPNGWVVEWGIGLTQPQPKPDPPFYDFLPTHLSTRINLFLSHGREVSEDIIKAVTGMDIVTDLSQKPWSRDNESSPSDLSARSVAFAVKNALPMSGFTPALSHLR